MRELAVSVIRDKVKELFLKASFGVPDSIRQALERAYDVETSVLGREVLKLLLKNNEIANQEQVPLCQDTGISVVFLDIGQEVRLVGGELRAAVNSGVRAAYQEGYLRKSVVADPIFLRKNTGDNTPAVIHVDIVPKDRVEIVVMPKGFGSENMSKLAMLAPADGRQGVVDFVMKTVKAAGPNACPPLVVGIGIGGTLEKAALLAKRAIVRGIEVEHPDRQYAELEREILTEINKLGIGPAGLGGVATALAVNIEHFPTHIAGLPVAVNICCHAVRHARTVI